MKVMAGWCNKESRKVEIEEMVKWSNSKCTEVVVAAPANGEFWGGTGGESEDQGVLAPAKVQSGPWSLKRGRSR